MITQKYLLTKKDSTFKSIKLPSEEEIRSAYNLNKAQFVRPETVRFSMIQVPYGADAASRARAKDLADRLAREIGSSASKFDEVVARGQSPNSGYQAGDGGYLPRTADAQNIVGMNFLNTAFSLKQGEVSKLMEGVPGTGYQIIKLTESYQMKTLELNDIVQLGTNVTVRDYIGNVMLQERQQLVLAQATQELVTDLRKNNPFRIYQDNIKW
jgi:parvulin-like peptidyl-prolyl isomerase